MNPLNEEVFAAIMALIVVGSAIGIAQVLKPETISPFTAFGLLNEKCEIGDYPAKAFYGENLTLCLLIYNNEGSPLLAQIRYKVGTNDTLPSDTAPSKKKPIKIYEAMLSRGKNITIPIQAPVTPERALIGKRAALIFELWIYNVDERNWTYTGKWVHLYLEILEEPLP